MKTSFKALLGGALLGLASLSAPAASFILVNTDDPGVGFNDSTPAMPVGGNAGTTVGQQRLIAYGRALQLWGSVLKSDVPITVLGSFAPLTCTAGGGTLAQAGAWNLEINFPNAPLKDVWYHGALANSIAGLDITPGAGSTPDDAIIDGADVIAFFNGSLGSTGCLEGSTWYYGLDNNASGSQIDFLNVFMHELSHGLGFSNQVSEVSGRRFLGLQFNDIFMTFQKDMATGKYWSEMTAAEIVAAAIRDGKEVWTGPNVTARAPLVLGPATVLSISAPATVAGEKDFLAGAQFGAAPTSAAFSGTVVAGVRAGTGDVNDGCTAYTNAAAVAGKVAIVRRGTCGFVVKAKMAQNAGAKAVIIANNNNGGVIGMAGVDPTVTIPAISIAADDGNALIGAGSSTSNGFVVSATRKAGTDKNGFVRIYAPTTVASGSSGSHFDVVAEPSLLLEPAITPLLEASHNVDLTLALFEDIGWKTEISVAGCGAGSGSRGASITGEIYAAPIFICADNAKNKGAFQSCSVHSLTDLMKAGLISGATKDVLGTCTATGGK